MGAFNVVNVCTVKYMFKILLRNSFWYTLLCICMVNLYFVIMLHCYQIKIASVLEYVVSMGPPNSSLWWIIVRANILTLAWVKYHITA